MIMICLDALFTVQVNAVPLSELHGKALELDTLRNCEGKFITSTEFKGTLLGFGVYSNVKGFNCRFQKKLYCA